ncbi:MAG: hypothetical protein KBD55_02110 [Candidatus Pacebacteria bacterium]|nr:hypothetical protein [Candidatus Paceibacterota bacterium]
MNIISLFILLAGFVVGLGAVTVIDLHGFLGRKSKYWTEATTRTHKVTKPLIWLGMILVIIGGAMFYKNTEFTGLLMFHLISVPIMILNGIFLSFSVSPFLLQREKEGREGELLPKNWQTKITLSFILSFVSWWGNLFILVWYITTHLVR